MEWGMISLVILSYDILLLSSFIWYLSHENNNNSNMNAYYVSVTELSAL